MQAIWPNCAATHWSHEEQELPFPCSSDRCGCKNDSDVFAARAMTGYHYLGRPLWPINYRLGLLFLPSTDSESFRHQDQIGQRLGAHFSHEVAPMDLHCLLG
jgi:hypothetical protein